MKTIRNSLILLSLFTLSLAAQAKSASLPLKVGDKAPLVKGVDQDGEKWKLATEIGKNVLLLYFYPKDNTPGCTKEACSLRDRIGDLTTQGVKVIGVSFDSVDSHKSFVFKYDLNFPLISDPDGKIADAYGARMDGGRKRDRRISFLIGMNGRIVHITDSPNPDDHLEQMRLAIKRLNSTGSP